MMDDSLLVTGGARSGKTGLAQNWCAARAAPRVYLATAERIVDDAEMAERIARHRSDRADIFARTIEEPLAVATAIEQAVADGAGTILVDCITLWLNNLGQACDWHAESVLAAVDTLAVQLADPPCPVAVVTNEVGSGIVPMAAVSRTFRDLQGWANQRLAAAAGSVALCACGLPLWLKGGPG